MNFSGKQKMLIEVCVRIMLYELLLKDQQHIHNFTAHLHNLNTGGFGEKEYFFEDTTDWVSCLQDMRDIIATIDPVFHQKQLDSGAIGLILPEEQLKSRTLNVNVQNTSIHIQMEQRTEEQECAEEEAREQAMLHGVQARNDARGYNLSAPDPCGHHCDSDCHCWEKQ